MIPSSTADCGLGEGRGPQGLGRDLGPLIVADGLAQPLVAVSARAARTPAVRPTATTGASAARCIVAATDDEARAHVFSPESGYRHFFGHMHKVYSQLGRLCVFKSRPDMRDDEVTVDTLIEQRTIYGSPKTVLSELIALRERPGRSARCC